MSKQSASIKHRRRYSIELSIFRLSLDLQISVSDRSPPRFISLRAYQTRSSYVCYCFLPRGKMKRKKHARLDHTSAHMMKGDQIIARTLAFGHTDDWPQNSWTKNLEKQNTHTKMKMKWKMHIDETEANTHVLWMPPAAFVLCCMGVCICVYLQTYISTHNCIGFVGMALKRTPRTHRRSTL